MRSFHSSDRKGTAGIEFGSEWYSAIMAKLGDATDVVALLTQNSVDRPWILYEAGIAKGRLGTTVLGLTLGMPVAKVTRGPFSQFQNCGDDEDSLTKLMLQLITRNPDASPRPEAVRMHVKHFRKRIVPLLADHTAPDGSDSSEITRSLLAKNVLLERKIDSLSELIAAFVRQFRPLIGARARSNSKKKTQRNTAPNE